MPGMFTSIFLAGALSDGRVDARDEEGLFMPLMFIPVIPPLFCAGFLLAAVDLDLDFDLPLDLLPIFMPGMFCISCCARTGMLNAKSSAAKASAKSFPCRFKLFITSPQSVPA